MSPFAVRVASAILGMLIVIGVLMTPGNPWWLALLAGIGFGASLYLLATMPRKGA